MVSQACLEMQRLQLPLSGLCSCSHAGHGIGCGNAVGIKSARLCMYTLALLILQHVLVATFPQGAEMQHSLPVCLYMT